MCVKIPATIAIVDDHALTRKTLSCRFASLGYNIVMEAESVKEFIDQITVHSSSAPDICLLDIRVPVTGWLETAIRFKRNWPGIKILFFSMQNGSVYMNRAREVGADGYLCKDASSEEFNKALYALLPPVFEV